MPGPLAPCLAVFAAAAGQSGIDPPDDLADWPTPPDLVVTVLSGAWLPRLGGESSLGPNPVPINLAVQLDLDDLEPSLNLELSLRRDDIWTLTLGGSDFSTTNRDTFIGRADFGALRLADGDPFTASFNITSVFADLAVGIWRPFTSSPERVRGLDNRTDDGHFLANLRISPLFGGRYIDVDQSISAGGARDDGGGEWLALYGGLQFTLDYRPDLTMLQRLRLQAALGLGPALGRDNGFAWQIRAGMTLQVTQNFGVLVGYRLLEVDVESDDYMFDGGLQGLFLAGSLRF